MSCSPYLWGDLIKNKGGVGFFQFHKSRDFFTSFDNQLLLGVIFQCGFPSCTLRFGQEENIPGQPTESRAYGFILKIVRMLPILTSRDRMMNAYIIVKITPACKRVHRISFSIAKRPSFSPLFGQEQNILGQSFERRVYQFVLKATKVFPIVHTGRLNRNLNILLMVNINPIYKR